MQSARARTEQASERERFERDRTCESCSALTPTLPLATLASMPSASTVLGSFVCATRASMRLASFALVSLALACGDSTTPPPGMRDGDVDTTDRDGDGLCNETEGARMTNPDVADTDGDGWSDFWEILAATDPLENSKRSQPGSEQGIEFLLVVGQVTTLVLFGIALDGDGLSQHRFHRLPQRRIRPAPFREEAVAQRGLGFQRRSNDMQHLPVAAAHATGPGACAAQTFEAKRRRRADESCAVRGTIAAPWRRTRREQEPRQATLQIAKILRRRLPAGSPRRSFAGLNGRGTSTGKARAQPGLRGRPVAMRRTLGHAQCIGDLLHVQADEVT